MPLIALALVLATAWPEAGWTGELYSYAFVQDDGSLRIKNRTVHLSGVYIPPTANYCQDSITPRHCGSRAVLALEFKIQGFVRCVEQSTNVDRSVNGYCYVDSSRFDPGEDLGAYLIEQGWALATPDAPFEYQALERIARHRGMGIWGFPYERW